MRIKLLSFSLALSCQSLFGTEPALVKQQDILTKLLEVPEETRSIAVVEKTSVSLQAILFKFGTAELDGPQSERQLEELGKALADPRLKSAVFEVQGHTDNVGSDEANQNLSEKRALKVVEILTRQHALQPQQLQAVGKGESSPSAGTKDLQTDEQRALNRRVVVERLK